jgi:hypothetical protein
MTRWRTIAVYVLSAAAFGVVVAVVKGQDTGVRDVIGNLSAPWVVVPFLAGAAARGAWRGALLGVVVTLAALLGFYVAEAAVLDLGPHPWYVDLRLTLHWNVYETWGIVSGLVYGALGAVWARRRSVAALACVGLAFAAEPLVVLFLDRRGIWTGGELFRYAWLWGGEVALGLAAVTYAVSRATFGPRRRLR